MSPCPHFNPPTPCGVGRGINAAKSVNMHFNPPTPCGVGPEISLPTSSRALFQSTHPVWGGTFAAEKPVADCRISIHPPRVGWDATGKTWSISRKRFQSTHPVWGGTLLLLAVLVARLYFNPPTPCGVGHTIYLPFDEIAEFQSTHPVWGGTMIGLQTRFALMISIHPPRVGWDNDWIANSFCFDDFNPPTPCGVGQ